MADVLVVTSKIKKLIKSKGNMQTSADAIKSLSSIVESTCFKAIDAAKNDGRKTVMARDIE